MSKGAQVKFPKGKTTDFVQEFFIDALENKDSPSFVRDTIIDAGIGSATTVLLDRIMPGSSNILDASYLANKIYDNFPATNLPEFPKKANDDLFTKVMGIYFNQKITEYNVTQNATHTGLGYLSIPNQLIDKVGDKVKDYLTTNKITDQSIIDKTKEIPNIIHRFFTEKLPSELKNVYNSWVNDTKKISPEDLEKLQKEIVKELAIFVRAECNNVIKNFDSLNKKVDDLQKTANDTQKQTARTEETTSKLHSLAQQQNEEERFRNFTNNLATIGNGVASAAGRLWDTKTATDIQIVTSASISIITHMSALTVASRSTSVVGGGSGFFGVVSTVAPYFGIASAVLSLMGLFGSSDNNNQLGESLNNIQNMIVDLSKQLEKFEKNMYECFDQLNINISNNHRQVLKGLLEIARLQENTADRIKRFEKLYKENRIILNDKLNDLKTNTEQHFQQIQENLCSLRVEELNTLMISISELTKIMQGKGLDNKIFHAHLINLYALYKTKGDCSLKCVI